MKNAVMPELGFDLEDGILAEDLPPLCDNEGFLIPGLPSNVRPPLSFDEDCEISVLSEGCREIYAQVSRAQRYLDVGCLRKSWKEYQAVLGKAQAECREYPLQQTLRCDFLTRFQWIRSSGRAFLHHNGLQTKPNVDCGRKFRSSVSG